MAEFAIKMNRSHHFGKKTGKLNLLLFKYVYMDAMHKRFNGYKRHTMWGYSPSIRKVLHMATMECETENAEMLTTFWKLFVEVVENFRNKPGHKFNPYSFVCDEHGGNINSIHNIFGNTYLGKIKTCQFHFLSCVDRQHDTVSPYEWESFRYLAHELCYSKTFHGYEEMIESFSDICTRNNVEESLEQLQIP